MLLSGTSLFYRLYSCTVGHPCKSGLIRTLRLVYIVLRTVYRVLQRVSESFDSILPSSPFVPYSDCHHDLWFVGFCIDLYLCSHRWTASWILSLYADLPFLPNDRALRRHTSLSIHYTLVIQAPQCTSWTHNNGCLGLLSWIDTVALRTASAITQ